ncbi:MAG: ATP-binding protein [Pseudomonadota bacterium]
MDGQDSTTKAQELHLLIQQRLVEELSASERRYRELVESVREVVFKCDIESKITFLNHAWQEILGYPVKDCVGHSVGEYMLEGDRDSGLLLLGGDSSGGGAASEASRELRFVRSNGEPVWLMLSVRDVENEGRVGSLHNIDQRKRAEQALKEINEQLEFRVEQRTAELADSNRRLGSEVEERKRAQEELNRAFSKLKETQESLLRAERLAVVGETSGRVAHEVLNPITSIFSRVEHNIDQWKEFKEALDSTREIVGDWQTEYQSGGFSEYLGTQNDDGTKYGDEDFKLLNSLIDNALSFQGSREEDLKFVHKQLQRVIKIINTLRESVRTQRSVKKVNIALPIEEALDALEDSLKKRKIEVVKTIPSDLPLILADESEMIQVFSNIYRNAMQSIEEKKEHGGVLSTTLSLNGETIEIRIRDTGTGIPEEVQGAIFNFEFSTKTRDQGTGLGLGISRRFVRECGGDLVLEKSTVGIGTTFLITIPTVKENHSSAS